MAARPRAEAGEAIVAAQVRLALTSDRRRERRYSTVTSEPFATAGQPLRHLAAIRWPAKSLSQEPCRKDED
jgi:hypothetical protein